MANNSRGPANISRSKHVRKNLSYVINNMGLRYKIISEKSGISPVIISYFLKGKRELNDVSLDRLEPVVNDFIEILNKLEGKC